MQIMKEVCQYVNRCVCFGIKYGTTARTSLGRERERACRSLSISVQLHFYASKNRQSQIMALMYKYRCPLTVYIGG